jgi:hypothetical protein
MGGTISVLVEFSDNVVIVGSNISGTIVQDDQINIVLNGEFVNATYVLTVNNNATVAILNSILSNFTYELTSSILDDSTTLTIVPYSNGNPILFSDIRDKMGTPTKRLLMSIIAQRSFILDPNAINFDYQTIESTEKTRNINVYAGSD